MNGIDPRVAARRLLSRHIAAWIPAGERGTVRIQDAVDAIVAASAAPAVVPTREGDEARAREFLAGRFDQQGSRGAAQTVRAGEPGVITFADAIRLAADFAATQPRAEAGEGVAEFDDDESGITKLEGLASMLDGYARDCKRKRWPETARTLDEAAKFLRQYEIVRLAAAIPDAPIPTPPTPESDATAKAVAIGDRVTVKGEREVYGDGTVVAVEGDAVKVAWDRDPRLWWEASDHLQISPRRRAAPTATGDRA